MEGRLRPQPISQIVEYWETEATKLEPLPSIMEGKGSSLSSHPFLHMQASRAGKHKKFTMFSEGFQFSVDGGADFTWEEDGTTNITEVGKSVMVTCTCLVA